MGRVHGDLFDPGAQGNRGALGIAPLVVGHSSLAARGDCLGAGHLGVVAGWPAVGSWRVGQRVLNRRTSRR
jgi:hypothetical protein